MSEMTTTAIANWYGSNRMLAEHVGAELAGCAWVGVVFGGGMCEVPHIAARQILVNDLHRHVINLARVAKHPRQGPKLYRALRRFAFHPDELAEAQERCLEREALTENPDELFARTDRAGLAGRDHRYDDDDRFAWAMDYFVSTWMGRGGKGGTDGEFRGGLPIRWNAGGGASVVRFHSAVRSLVAWKATLKRCEFSIEDAFDFLGNVVDHADTGVYCDPPFPGPGDKYVHQLPAKGGMSGQERLAAAVSAFKSARVVMRFYDVPLIRELYAEGKPWTWIRLEGRTQTNGKAAEVLIINGPSRSGGPSRAASQPKGAK